SASKTTAPRSASIRATVDLPDARPPVRPIRSTEVVRREPPRSSRDTRLELAPDVGSKVFALLEIGQHVSHRSKPVGAGGPVRGEPRDRVELGLRIQAAPVGENVERPEAMERIPIVDVEVLERDGAERPAEMPPKLAAVEDAALAAPDDRQEPSRN